MVKAGEIAGFLGKELYGEDIEIDRPRSIEEITDGACVFFKRYDEDILYLLNKYKVFAVLPCGIKPFPSCSFVLSDNPRLDMARLINEFFVEKKEPNIAKTAIISDGVLIGENVSIGEYCVLDGNISIGAGTVIGHHVRIIGETTIGNNCHIKSGVSIGEDGFGFERDENDINVHFPQIGTIEIGDNVSIGANSTVERAALGVTRIEDGVAVDDLTQIGHNVTVGKGSTICNGAVLCGGSVIGKRCNIAPNACVRQRLRVGDDSIVGLGAVVVKDVPSNSVFAGNPAKRLEKKS